MIFLYQISKPSLCTCVYIPESTCDVGVEYTRRVQALIKILTVILKSTLTCEVFGSYAFLSDLVERQPRSVFKSMRLPPRTIGRW